MGTFDWVDSDGFLERPDTLPAPLKFKQKIRRRNLSALRQEKLEEFLTELPGAGESLHTVSNGHFDYWHFVPVTLKLIGQPAEEFYGSTWTMSRPNALDLLRLYDEGEIKQISLLSGLYFKRRESAVYTTISSGLIDRGQRFLCHENHTKIILLSIGNNRIVIEGSVNFTANPRIEQNVITNDRELYEFHQGWMEGVLNRNLRRRKTKSQLIESTQSKPVSAKA